MDWRWKHSNFRVKHQNDHCLYPMRYSQSLCGQFAERRVTWNMVIFPTFVSWTYDDTKHNRCTNAFNTPFGNAKWAKY